MIEMTTDRTGLMEDVEEAARVIAPLWPLDTFVAVNPLWDLRHLGFHGAIRESRPVLGVRGYPSAGFIAHQISQGRITEQDLEAARASSRAPGRAGRPERNYTLTRAEEYDRATGSDYADKLDREVAKWCAAFLAGQGGAQSGFHAAWREAVIRDPGARRLLGRAGRAALASVPADPEAAVLKALEDLKVDGDERVPQLSAQLARMPGWAGHAKWRSLWAGENAPGPSIELIDYLAVRLSYEAALLQGLQPANKGGSRPPSTAGGSQGPRRAAGKAGSDPGSGHADSERGDVALAAYEIHYRDILLAALDKANQPRRAVPQAQAVFCIDTRSEGIRRHLEAHGDYETFGFAGFFGIALDFHALGAQEGVALCPVLLTPGVKARELPSAGADLITRRWLTAGRSAEAAREAFEEARGGWMASYTLAEAAGLAAAPVSTLKTLAPTLHGRLRSAIGGLVAPEPATTIEIEAGMDDEAQARFAHSSLTTMGLTGGFAPLVALIGHGSTTENNPFASSLDCGACGGNRGLDSARAAAAVLNRPVVRKLVAEMGIRIPEETYFVAGEHDTATDTVTIADTGLVPPSHADALARLQADLDRAGRALAEERAGDFPKHRHGRAGAHRRSRDWAEVQPEWGLARNAAFIVGPRSMTENVNLGRRTFLHSYDHLVDPQGKALEAILTAPMVVAHWINAQYYFSTVDPEVFSAGDKVAHNIVAGIGVVQGTGGDLKPGLPLQSLFYNGRPYHEPMRLLCVIQAPSDLIEEVIARNGILQELFDGEWVHLAARDSESSSWRLRGPGGSWAPWRPAGQS